MSIFSNLFSFLKTKKKSTDQKDLHYTSKNFMLAFILVTLVFLALMCFLPGCSIKAGILTFLSVASACFAFGAAIGFLFGLPRAEKYRFNKDGTINHNENSYSYSDNANLEEVSDWLTKIILGLTLIKLNTILHYIHTSAMSISYSLSKCCEDCAANYYVFGYAVMVLYFFAGGGMMYIWTRTNLSLIFRDTKMQELEIENRKLKDEKKTLVTEVQRTQNEEIRQARDIKITEPILHDYADQPESTEVSPEFRNLIEQIYNAKPVYDKDDIQKGRWGGNDMVNNYILEAFYQPTLDGKFSFGIRLSVRSLSPNRPLEGDVAFFLHDSFTDEIEYAAAKNNQASIEIAAYESFVVGARTIDGAEMELNLNNVKGFPAAFYV